MLLPSAFACEGSSVSSQILHSSSASTRARLPMASPRHRRTLSSDIYNTCHALQNRLLSNLSYSPRSTVYTPALLPSPIIQPSTNIHPSVKPQSAKQPTRGFAKEVSQESPRSSKKRCRPVSDDDSLETTAINDAPSTPKRQRITPPYLPLGITSEDFDDLSHKTTTSEGICGQPSSAISVPLLRRTGSSKPLLRPHSPMLSASTYSTSLVALLKEKFSLRQDVCSSSEPDPQSMDERLRSLIATAAMARGQTIRKEMVIRRRGRRERKSSESLW